MLRLYNLLGSAPALCSNKLDVLVWTADSSRIFSVSSAYILWDSRRGPLLDMAGVIWNNCAPPKAQFFGSLAWQEKVKTTSFLHRIGILGGNVNINCVFLSK